MIPSIPKDQYLTPQAGENCWLPNPKFASKSTDVKVFQNIQVKLLRTFTPKKQYKVGTIVKGHLVPSGQFYLLNLEGQVMCSTATEGVDFEIIDQ